jgi:hypothetical protein
VRIPDAGGGDIDSSGGAPPSNLTATYAVGFAARRLVIVTAATLSSSGELASSGEPAIVVSVPLRGSAGYSFVLRGYTRARRGRKRKRRRSVGCVCVSGVVPIWPASTSVLPCLVSNRVL